VRRIHVHGNRAKSAREILETLSLATSRPLPDGWPSVPLGRLIEAYQNDGRWFFRIDSVRTDYAPDSTRADVSIWLREGGPVRVRDVRIHGVHPSAADALTRNWDTEPGAVFYSARLGSDIENALIGYENTGYPLARVIVDSLNLEESPHDPLLDVVLTVEPGDPVRFGMLHARGNSATREGVVLRETRIHTGQIYSQARLRAARDNLMRTGYFESVSDPEVRLRDGRADIVFPVEEGRPNTVEGVAGYSPSPVEGRRGSVTGRLDFSFQNLLGTGRRVLIYWEKKDMYSQAMRVGYEEPWLLGYPLFAGGRFEQQIRDTTYLERDWRLSLRFAPTATLSLGLEGGRKSILPDSLGSTLMGFMQTEAWVVAGRIGYNTFNDPFNPTRGVRYHTVFSTGRKRITGPDFLIPSVEGPLSVVTRRIDLDFEIVFRIARRQVIFTGLHGIEIRSGERFTPVTEQARFGGATTLRGYIEDAFRGDLVAWFNLEHRYLIGRRSRVFVFLDGGMYQRRETVRGLVRGEKLGWGFGLRIETRLGLIGIDYGLGEGDGIMQGKVHVGLVNQF